MSESVVGEWAKDKLARLHMYLNPYTTILKEQTAWCEGFYYVDAFAGPGFHEIRKPLIGNAENSSSSFFDDFEEVECIEEISQSSNDQRELIDGSPRIALNLKYPFTSYFFVELSTARVGLLQQLQTEYSSHDIHIVQADCRKFLHDFALNTKWSKKRAVVFLDPFGMQVDWETIEVLARTRSIEIFLNFPAGMAINRMLPRDHTKITSGNRNKLDRYFGTDQWFSEFYFTRPKTGQMNFFEEIDAEITPEQDVISKVRNANKRLATWYRKRLGTVFRKVSKAALIRTSRGVPLYYLIWAGHYDVALEIANHVLSAGEFVE